MSVMIPTDTHKKRCGVHCLRKPAKLTGSWTLCPKDRIQELYKPSPCQSSQKSRVIEVGIRNSQEIPLTFNTCQWNAEGVHKKKAALVERMYQEHIHIVCPGNTQKWSTATNMLVGEGLQYQTLRYCFLEKK